MPALWARAPSSISSNQAYYRWAKPTGKGLACWKEMHRVYCTGQHSQGDEWELKLSPGSAGQTVCSVRGWIHLKKCTFCWVSQSLLPSTELKQLQAPWGCSHSNSSKGADCAGSNRDEGKQRLVFRMERSEETNGMRWKRNGKEGSENQASSRNI